MHGLGLDFLSLEWQNVRKLEAEKEAGEGRNFTICTTRKMMHLSHHNRNKRRWAWSKKVFKWLKDYNSWCFLESHDANWFKHLGTEETLQWKMTHLSHHSKNKRRWNKKRIQMAKDPLWIHGVLTFVIHPLCTTMNRSSVSDAYFEWTKRWVEL